MRFPSNTSMHGRRRPFLIGIAFIFAIAVFAGAVFAVFKLAPDLAETKGLGPKDRAAELGRVRTSLLASLAGLLAIGTALLSWGTYALSRSGQMTERFTKAVEQMGAGTTEVQIGGIFALERIARDSPRDHPAVMELLTEFVRINAHRVFVRDKPCGDDGGNALDDEHFGEIRELLIFERPADRGAIQAAVTVIGRRDDRFDRRRQIDLRSSDLARLDLHQAKLSRAKLSRNSFAKAWLAEADLRYTSLRDSCLDDAALEKTELQHARLHGCSLRRAWLQKADLRHANLTGADLDSADLRGADLRGAIVEDTRWGACRYSATTRWPTPDFRPPPSAALEPDDE